MVFYELRTPCILNFLACASDVLRHNLDEEARTLGLMDCVECGCCTYVCPSGRPMVHMFSGVFPVWVEKHPQERCENRMFPACICTSSVSE